MGAIRAIRTFLVPLITSGVPSTSNYINLFDFRSDFDDIQNSKSSRAALGIMPFQTSQTRVGTMGMVSGIGISSRENSLSSSLGTLCSVE
jgi:hypothetical protein